MFSEEINESFIRHFHKKLRWGPKILGHPIRGMAHLMQTIGHCISVKLFVIRFVAHFVMQSFRRKLTSQNIQFCCFQLACNNNVYIYFQAFSNCQI